MEEIFSNDVYKELIMVLSNCDNKIIDKIPDELLDSINKKAAESDKEFFFSNKKRLEEQSLTSECLELLSIIYYNYVADEGEKKEIVGCWIKNNIQ